MSTGYRRTGNDQITARRAAQQQTLRGNGELEGPIQLAEMESGHQMTVRKRGAVLGAATRYCPDPGRGAVNKSEAGRQLSRKTTVESETS
jgi:hypothetical protein